MTVPLGISASTTPQIKKAGKQAVKTNDLTERDLCKSQILSKNLFIILILSMKQKNTRQQHKYFRKYLMQASFLNWAIRQ
jgi:hypothetical protein